MISLDNKWNIESNGKARLTLKLAKPKTSSQCNYKSKEKEHCASLDVNLLVKREKSF